MREPFCFRPEQISRMTLGEVLFYNNLSDEDEGDDKGEVKRKVANFWAEVEAKAKRLGMTPEAYWERERRKQQGGR